MPYWTAWFNESITFSRNNFLNLKAIKLFKNYSLLLQYNTGEYGSRCVSSYRFRSTMVLSFECVGGRW
jgi:hypothetical protein